MATDTRSLLRARHRRRKILRQDFECVYALRATLTTSPVAFVRPAGRTHLGVKVSYEPDRGNR